MAPSFNPYEVLQLEKTATEKEIQKAYKLQCLKWHPDKNLDNKEQAQAKFLLAKEAFQILFDKEQRAEFDTAAEKVRVRDERQRERMAKADGERKKFIDDLERREKEFAERNSEEAKKKRPKTQQELNRMRSDFEELRKRLEEEANEEIRAQQKRVKEMRDRQNGVTPSTAACGAKLKCKWRPAKGRDWTEQQLRDAFAKFGSMSAVIVMDTKKGRAAVVEFHEGGWGADKGVEGIEASWLDAPQGERVEVETITLDEEGKEKGRKEQTGGGDDFAAMSLEELQAKLLGDMQQDVPPPEKKARKWHEEEEEK